MQIQSGKTKWRRFPRTFYLMISGIMMLLTSVVAYGDEYNFFFDKPKAGGSESSAPVQIPAPVVAPAKAGPIIINNNVSVPNTLTVPTAVAAATPTAAMAGAIAAEGSQADVRPKLRLGLSAIVVKVPGSGELTAENFEKSAGLMVSLGYRMEPWFGVNGYLGQAGSTGQRTLGGADLELLPIRYAGVLELGVLAGSSNFTGRIDRVDALHAGARLNLNAGEHFSISAAGRFGKEMSSAELGISVNI